MYDLIIQYKNVTVIQFMEISQFVFEKNYSRYLQISSKNVDSLNCIIPTIEYRTVNFHNYLLYDIKEFFELVWITLL